jgi:hypothetical protein
MAEGSDSTSKEDTQMQFASRKPAMAACFAALLLAGGFHGFLDGRWSDRPNLEQTGARLNELPANCGDWELISDTKLDDKSEEILQCYGSVVREYLKPSTGDRVNVFVVFGPRGPIAVHTPEVCYSSTGTESVGDRVPESLLVGGNKHQLWKVQFRKANTQSAPHLEVWYGWSDGSVWHAAKHPRVWMTDRLYKIQAAGPPAGLGEATSPVEDFLEVFLPALNNDAIRKI